MNNPFRETEQTQTWVNAQELDSFNYTGSYENRRQKAENRFKFMLDMVKDRIDENAVIVDVGCASGHFLEHFYNNGYTNLYGIDPQKSAVEFAKRERPYLTIKEGVFGPQKFDIPCDLLVFFSGISKIPYRDRVFDAIERCARKYVLIRIQEAMNEFDRDVHVELAKRGFLCIDKRVVTKDFKPIGIGDEPLIEITEEYTNPVYSHFLFRRIEPKSKPKD